MDYTYIVENERERQRLKTLAERLTDDEMAFTLENGWVISETFAHLAFWDQYALAVIRKWRQSVVWTVAVDFNVVNESLRSLCRALPPRAAAELAIRAAEAIDREIEGLSPDMVSDVLAQDQRSRLYRSEHRKRHLDGIERRLKDGI